jgi:hypothetical protein
MINNPDQSNVYLTWQAILWRLLLTLLLLLALAGPGLNLFSGITASSETQTRPSFTQEVKAGR